MGSAMRCKTIGHSPRSTFSDGTKQMSTKTIHFLPIGHFDTARIQVIHVNLGQTGILTRLKCAKETTETNIVLELRALECLQARHGHQRVCPLY